MIERLKRFYRDPEQELLRREVAWFRGWALRGPGKWWLVGYGVVTLVPFIAILGWVIQIVLWIQLLRRRTFAPLEGGRLSDTLMTGLGNRNLWPALMAAPLLLKAVTVIWSGVVGLAWTGIGTLLGSTLGMFGLMTVRGGWALEFPVLVPIAVTLQTVTGMLAALGMTAFVTRNCLRRSTVLSIVLYSALFMIILWVVAMGVSIAGYIGGAMAGWLAAGIVMLGGPVLTGLASWMIWKMMLAMLLSLDLRCELAEKLARSGEAPAMMAAEVEA